MRMLYTCKGTSGRVYGIMTDLEKIIGEDKV